MWQMPFLSKEMAESVRNEIVLHSPILMHGGGGGRCDGNKLEKKYVF